MATTTRATPRAPVVPGRRRARAALALAVAGGFAVGCAGNDPGGGTVSVADPGDGSGARVTIDAVDNGFRPATILAPEGPLTVELRQRGRFRHTLLVEGVDGFVLEVGHGEDRDVGTLDLGPGTYTMWCDVPGHRAQGMVGAIVVGRGPPPHDRGVEVPAR